MDDTASFSIRIPAELRDAIKDAAKAQRRSANSLIVLILEEWFATHAETDAEAVVRILQEGRDSLAKGKK